MLAILCFIGIHVLKREIIFIDIALAQIAAVGAIAAHVIFHIHGHSIYGHLLALGATLVAAAFFAVVRRRIDQIPLEAVIGVSYAVSAAAALFLVGVAPGGHVHIQEMLAGSILWASWNDILWSAVVFAVIGLLFYVFRGPFREISEDYESASARGYNTLAWDFLFYALVGVVITTAVRIAGVVVVFTFLIIPATLSAVFASGWAGRLAIAWVGGAVSAALGLLFAARYDFSVGPAIALFLGAVLIVVGLLRSLRVARMPTVVTCLLAAVILGVWLAAGSARLGGGSAARYGGAPNTGTITHAHSNGSGHDHGPPAVTHTEDVEIDAERLASINDIERLEALYSETSDVEERNMIASRALEVDITVGVQMAIEYLRDDPPLLFRMTIIDKLEEVIGSDLPYDIDEPFSAPSNQETIRRLDALSRRHDER
jgi:zinc/manganese transport system permease protein